MSVTGWKRKKKITKILIMFGVAGAPLMLLIVFLSGLCMDLSERLKEYEAEEKQLTTYIGFALKNEKKNGEEIQVADLEKVEITGEKGAKMKSAKPEDYIGKCCKTDLKAGSLLMEEVLAQPETFRQDLRKQTFSQISYFGPIGVGDRVDIRISFPTGEDYVIVGKKEVLGTGEMETEEESGAASLTFCLGEEELLRLSSAFIDMDTYPGTYVYALPYVDSFQEQAYTTYPINRQVFSLMGWDPNVAFSARTEEDFYDKEQAIRQELEKNLGGLFGNENQEEAAVSAEELQSEPGYDEEVEFFP